MENNTIIDNVTTPPPGWQESTQEIQPVELFTTIDFTKTSEDGKYSFSDALHLPVDHTFTEEDIEAMKQERFDNWLSYILAPVPEEDVAEPPVIDTPEPTV